MKQERSTLAPSLQNLSKLDLSAIGLIIAFTSRERSIELLINGGKTQEESTQIVDDYYLHFKQPASESEGVVAAVS